MFDEVSLPDDIAELATAVPTFSTKIVTMVSGKEQRVGLNARARLRMVLSQLEMTPVQMETLLAFYRAHRGQLVGFRVKDWSDYKALDEPLDNSAGGTSLQLVKTYGTGTYTGTYKETRTIKKPVAGTVTLKKNGVAWASSGNWTLNTTTGILTLTAAQVGAVIAWSGEFDVPMRFETDAMSFANAAAVVRNIDQIPLVEIL